MEEQSKMELKEGKIHLSQQQINETGLESPLSFEDVSRLQRRCNKGLWGYDVLHKGKIYADIMRMVWLHVNVEQKRAQAECVEEAIGLMAVELTSHFEGNQENSDGYSI